MLDYIDKHVEEWNDLASRLKPWSVKGYIDGEFQIVFNVRFRSQEYELVLRAIPLEHGFVCGVTPCDGHPEVLKTDDSGCDQCVFVTVTHLVEDVESILPSTVTAKPFKAFPDLSGNGCAAVQLGQEGAFIFAKRKTASSVSGVWVPIEKGTSVNGVIKSGPEIIDCIPDDKSNLPVRRRPEEAELVDLLAGFHVRLDNDFVGVVRTTSECPKNSIEILNVALCPVNL